MPRSTPLDDEAAPGYPRGSRGESSRIKAQRLDVRVENDPTLPSQSQGDLPSAPGTLCQVSMAQKECGPLSSGWGRIETQGCVHEEFRWVP